MSQASVERCGRYVSVEYFSPPTEEDLAAIAAMERAGRIPF